MQEEFEDNKGVIIIRQSKEDRQHNDQKKKDKSTNNDARWVIINQNYYIEKIELCVRRRINI